jgi:uncharacterized membrane protein YedE/YeeE
MFPNGIASYLLGGLVIGVGVSLIFALTSVRMGASSFFTTTLSWFSRADCFRKSSYLEERSWRLVFTVGLVLGALLHVLTMTHEPFATEVQPWRLLAGGLLAGFGARLAGGCTSGHGICGLSSLSRTSLVVVVTFMAVAIGVAQLMRALGVTP